MKADDIKGKLFPYFAGKVASSRWDKYVIPPPLSASFHTRGSGERHVISRGIHEIHTAMSGRGLVCMLYARTFKHYKTDDYANAGFIDTMVEDEILDIVIE